MIILQSIITYIFFHFCFNIQKGSCIDYYFRLYNNVRVTFSDQTLGYVNIIKNYTHPFLKLVSLYLVENYRRASEYFSKNGDNTQNVACEKNVIQVLLHGMHKLKDYGRPYNIILVLIIAIELINSLILLLYHRICFLLHVIGVFQKSGNV
ncbi:hypothetical protein PCYB_004100 [Plasmodium cynomolgi strain B]|uniref:Uncharacterized protein n=1 Tax=Plasmodium cynomolgi (strain B) TaxID=1120755 RepID=K6UF85_PLACD|nr:hypothetical protein PCYB_004100 [Plasmodium cynomolgi strain B]GAB69661.1 hypothetical protein PCYB_004100 [Plasmodium cynomolgi strain B]